jgi:hypothetical protein
MDPKELFLVAVAAEPDDVPTEAVAMLPLMVVKGVTEQWPLTQITNRRAEQGTLLGDKAHLL